MQVLGEELKKPVRMLPEIYGLGNKKIFGRKIRVAR